MIVRERLNRIIILVAAIAIVAFAAGAIIIRSPSPSAPAAEMKSERNTDSLSRAMTFTSAAEPKK